MARGPESVQALVIVANGLRGYGPRALEGSAVVAHEPSYPTGHVGSSWTRDQTRVPCIGRQTLNHWTSREVQEQILKAHITRKKLLTM